MQEGYEGCRRDIRGAVAILGAGGLLKDAGGIEGERKI